MQPIIAFNVIQKQFSKHESGLIKLEFDVNASAASTVYVQVHDFPSPSQLAAGLTAPPNTTSIPIKSWPTPAGAIDVYKEFKRGELEFQYGCFVCVSTTQATLTMGTGNNKFDSVAAELLSNDIVGTEIQGASGNTQDVWANSAATNHRLVRVAATNLESGVRYLQLFPVASSGLVSGTTIPYQVWTLAANGDSGGKDTVLKSFGGVGNNNLGGISFYGVDSTTKALQQGCSLALSSTETVYTATVDAGANYYAEYK